MLDTAEGRSIQEAIWKLSRPQMLAKVHANPSIKKSLGEIREKGSEFGPIDLSQFVSTEWLIDERKRELIGKLARREITQDERREFVELDCIRVQMMMPRGSR